MTKDAPLPHRAHLTLAVVWATEARQRVGAGGTGAGPRLAVGLAILALAFLAGISGMRETLAFFKHLLLQDAIWTGAGGRKRQAKATVLGTLLSPSA